MYLSDQDLEEAIAKKELIVDPFSGADPASIDLHLDSVEEAKIWNIAALTAHNKQHGLSPKELRIAKMSYGDIAANYLISPPDAKDATDEDKVFKRAQEVILKPGGFLLWQTKEIVGTPKINPKYICFIDGKSTRARTGLVVHLTAPTIHAGWHGQITLELANLGPLDIVLCENDAVAQIVVAQISSSPLRSKDTRAIEAGQSQVTGQSAS